ncbi:MAG: glucan biosynthesis protein G [Pseudomonadota bacterium]
MITPKIEMTRRQALAAMLGSAAYPAFAQKAAAPATPFSFDALIAQMQVRAAEPYAPPAPLDTFLSGLTYDDYRKISFRPEAARWAETDLFFTASAFHPGWLFQEPVVLNEVVAGEARPLAFSTGDFAYRQDLAGKVPADAALSGVAGLKIRYPLNRPDIFDELITFLGASYFRALGRGNSYGLSARGLSINTWLDGPEEFPRFSEFWVERPEEGAHSLVLYAALDSPSVTGAYRFVISPGADTQVDVDAHLSFRAPVAQLGIAPLTSMYYFSEHSERRFDDYRPQVHDSDALMILRGDGDVLLRPLNNPPRVSNSYFSEAGLAQFGLIQRDRAYPDYQDAGARYHDRPSVMIEPLNAWGPGAVRLVEIPTDLEIEDNIVAFWAPETAPLADETRHYAYRMHWGALPPAPEAVLAHVISTRSGVGGPSGVPVSNPNLRKFVVDFTAGALGTLPGDADPTPVVTASAGILSGVVLHRVDGAAATWRLIIDIDGQDAPLIELSAHIAGFNRKLSETWLFQWVRSV